ncbi:MAG TPA: hypothetical protein VKZ58_02770 [Longimicrobiales bacterium]|nr:hypothetical protein [Longimicrobiales bacterium]
MMPEPLFLILALLYSVVPLVIVGWLALPLNRMRRALETMAEALTERGKG